MLTNENKSCFSLTVTSFCISFIESHRSLLVKICKTLRIIIIKKKSFVTDSFPVCNFALLVWKKMLNLILSVEPINIIFGFLSWMSHLAAVLFRHFFFPILRGPHTHPLWILHIFCKNVMDRAEMQQVRKNKGLYWALAKQTGLFIWQFWRKKRLPMALYSSGLSQQPKIITVLSIWY